ncbi:MAG: FHA domain-containing protein [Bacteroidetes bacterium]|nr:FHA domain-containing protein [Bacteroidota bacterium]
MAANFFSKMFGKSDEPSKSASPAEEEFHTVKLAPTSDKTLKFIPGQFIMLSGKDRGKPFRVAGFPTPEGSIITIGRDPVTGERAFAHIQLDVQTISRQHAELIFKNGQLFIKNLSETNPIEVNDVEIKVGEEVSLPLDSELRLGEIRMKYILR